MVESLAELAAEGLECIKKIGIKEKKAYIGDNIFDIIPYEEENFKGKPGDDQISLEPILRMIKTKMQTDEIIPVGDNVFVSKDHAYWATKVRVVNLFTNKQLRELTKDSKASWIISKLPKRGNLEAFHEYINDITTQVYNPETLLNLIDKDFVRKQTQKWLIELYGYIDSNKELLRLAKKLPILLDQKKEPTAAYNEIGEPLIFIARDDDDTQYTVVYPQLAKNPEVKEFLHHIDVHKPELKDELYKYILPLYDNDNDVDPSKHWAKFLSYYKTISGYERVKFLGALDDKKFFSIEMMLM